MSDTLIALRELARDIEGYRIENDWKPKQLRAEIIGLPNEKTHTRLLDHDDACDDLDAAALLNKYTGAMERVTERQQAQVLAEPEYKDFNNVLDSLEAVRAGWLETGIHRTVVIVGENGAGKSTAIRFIQRDYPSALYVQADSFWKDSFAAMMEDCLLALNEWRNEAAVALDRYPLERQRAFLTAIAARKILLIINDAHYLSARGLGFLIKLVDTTKVVPVLVGIPQPMREMCKRNLVEARQLFGNRLWQFVTIERPGAGEIVEMWRRRGVRFADKKMMDAAASQVHSEADEFGNWTYVKLFTRDLVKASKGAAITDLKFAELYGTFKNRRHRYNKVTSLLKASA